MEDLKKIKKKRFRFIHRIYEESGGNRYNNFSMWEIGKELGLTHEETDSICQYLEGEGLIECVEFGGLISIKHEGIIEVEKALTEPEQSTQYFPPVINIIKVEKMENSQIQQGTISSTQRFNIDNDTFKIIEDFINLLKSKISELEILDEDKSVLEADIKTIDAQLKSKKPKISFINTCLLSIKKILEGAIGGIVANELLQYIPTILKKLGTMLKLN